jgi:hypothetical protein
MLDGQNWMIRVWNDLISGPSGPLGLRFIMQPIMATILAVRDGLKDARHDRSPYFWTILSDPARRWSRVREGLAAVSKVIALAIILDAVYQLIVLGRFYLGEALIVAFVLAFVPYLLIRGPVERIARRWNRRGHPSDHGR